MRFSGECQTRKSFVVISAQSATSADRTVVLIDAGEKVNRREVIKEYKNSIRPMGIVHVRNIRNNRVYLTASTNTVGIEYHRLQVWSNKMIEKAVHP